MSGWPPRLVLTELDGVHGKAVDIEETNCARNDANEQPKERTKILSELHCQFGQMDS